ncbi:hypothetical protein ACFQ60_47655, partial [Streptomyces zhihengii]
MELDMTFNQILIVALAVLAGSIAMVAMGQAAAIAALALSSSWSCSRSRADRAARPGCGRRLRRRHLRRGGQRTVTTLEPPRSRPVRPGRKLGPIVDGVGSVHRAWLEPLRSAYLGSGLT